MLRSAHAQALPQSRTRARVSKDEDVRLDSPSCFEMHRSARRPRKAPVLASRCDAPQHEGAGARRILAERSINQQLYEMTGGLPSLFPACSLQGMVQLTRVSRLASRSCKATRVQTCRVEPPSHSSRSSIDLARRVVVVNAVRIQGASSSDSHVHFDSYLEILVMKVCAPAAISSEPF